MKTKSIALLPLVTGIAVASSNAATPATPASSKPNIVIILADDQGYADVGVFGATSIRTPNLDAMAAEGVKLTQFYAQPVCSPSRASIMTGCDPARVGFGRVIHPGFNWGLPLNLPILPEALKKAGYATACIGKWHVGHMPPFLPTNRGVDYYYGLPYSNDMILDPALKLSDNILLRNSMTRERALAGVKGDGAPLMRGGEVIEYPVDQTTLTRRYTQEAVQYIKQNANRPFFLYLAHAMPHVPLAASEAFKGKSPRGLYGDACEEVDWSVGQVLRALKDAGIDDNTLVLYTSDNGPWQNKKEHGGSAGPLRGGKGSVFEGGVRVPAIVRWPGKIPKGTTQTAVAATIDLYPTITQLCGATIPNDIQRDGIDIMPALQMKEIPQAMSGREYFYTQGLKVVAVRSGKWKLLLTDVMKTTTSNYAKASLGKNPGDDPMLFDLDADAGETHNLAREHPDIVSRLKKSMETFDKKLATTSLPAATWPGNPKADK